MNSKCLLVDLYSLINNGMRVWIEHENIKLFVPKNVVFDSEHEKFIRNNKVEILNYLRDSDVYSKEYTNLIIKSKLNQQVLSYAQERLWFLERYESGTSAYNIPMVFRLNVSRGDSVELELLERGVRSLVGRHEILRTLIKEDVEGNGYQLVGNLVEQPLNINKIIVHKRADLEQRFKEEINHVYDLSTEYPIRLCVYELKDEHYVSIVIHHIAFDGWSTDIFLRDLQEYYRYYLNQSEGLESELNLPELSIQYKDFALWQRSYISGDRLDKQLSYWKSKLDGYETLNLIADKARPRETDYTGDDVNFEIDEGRSNKLRSLAKELKVSLYTVLLAGYYLMLRAYSNQNDIVIGTPIANRNYPQIENLIGFFVNTLALRVKIDSESSVKEFITKVGREVVDAQLYQDLPFEKLVEELKVAKDTSRSPIFQVMFGVQSFGSGLNRDRNKSGSVDESSLNNLLELYGSGSGDGLYNVAKFDLSVFIDDGQESLRGGFNYAVSLYNEETISNFTKTYTYILEQFVSLLGNRQKQETFTIAQLSYLTQAVYQQLIEEWNDTDSEYPDNKTIQALFEGQVERTPNNIAIVYEETKLTYRELNNEANKLANYLTNHYQIKPDSLIALCLDRSEHMLIAILAVLKAGGAYVPMDPGYPDERISYILADTQAQIVLSNEVHQERLLRLTALELEQAAQISKIQNLRTTETVEILSIDSTDFQSQCLLAATTNPVTTTASTNLAYVIYTSGTTGNPKGVMIEHKGVVNLVIEQGKVFELEESKHIKNCLCYANYIFDAHVWEIYTSLFKGHKTYIVGNIIRQDIALLSNYIQDNNISIATIPPILLNYKNILKVNTLVVAGEKANKALLDYYRSNNIKVINAYGPTEATVCISLNHYDNNGVANIGKPIANTQAYILNTNLQPLPIGAIGELYIGGVGLARGYLNRPDLTAEKFITNPFQTKLERDNKSYGSLGKNAKLYKTGDLVRYLPDGNIEYIGRNDFQVKIRGYRVELGEIENAISSYNGIKQSVVLAKEHTNIDGTNTGNKYLVGYYVAEHDHSPDQQGILNYLQTKLPEYMVPSILMKIDKLPLTLNGKLDRNALPDPEFISDINNYVAPRNDLEINLCSIWAEVLKAPEDKVGINDDFFRLGGNSILAIKLVSKLNNALDRSVNVSSIFKYSSISKLAHYLENEHEANFMIKRTEVSKFEEQVLSYAQERLWFIEKYEQGTNAYNIPMVFKLLGNSDISALKQAIEAIIERHEILRTLIKEDDEGNSYQFVLDNKTNPLIVRNIKVKNENDLNIELKKEVNHIYDLKNEYPIRVCLYELKRAKKTERFISLVIHHIAFDGWSVDILLKEIQEYYSYFLNRTKGIAIELSLPELSIQYKDFAIWQRNDLLRVQLDKQVAYWKNKLLGYDGLNLTTDHLRPKEIDYQGANINFEIDENISKNLRHLGKELKVSLYSVLLAGYYLMLRIYSNQNDIVIGTPIANRNYPQIENLIGFFVNTLALRVEIDSDSSVKEFITKVGRDVVEAQLHQDLPFEKLVEELNVENDLSRHPIFQVMFGVQSFASDLGSLSDILQPYDAGNNLYNVAKFDISTFIDDSQKDLKGSFNYATNLYSEETILGFVETYVTILSQLSEAVTNKESISQIEYLTQERYQQVINIWNETDRDFPRDKKYTSSLKNKSGRLLII